MSLCRIVEKLRGKPYPPPPSEEILKCCEVADHERLCKTPLVSVMMITYNHGKYIQEAVESIMAQQAPFEYELLIGEDCSSDDTRELALALQRRYPDRIRLFFGESNVGWNYNIERLRRNVRGRYIAWCEGDDYWIDQKKLEKQVSLIEKTDAAICVAFNYNLFPNGRRFIQSYQCQTVISYPECCHYFHTSTYLLKTDLLQKAHQSYPDISEWYDTVMLPCVASLGDICVLSELVSVYRLTNMGVATSLSLRGQRLLAISQHYQLYRFGPHELRGQFAAEIVRHAALYFYLRDKDSARIGGQRLRVFLLFVLMFPRVMARACAWKSLAYLAMAGAGMHSRGSGEGKCS